MQMLNESIWINVHAIVLIGLPIGTLAMLAICKKRKPRARDLLVGTIGAGIVSLSGLSCKHLCNQGDPFFQWLIPAVCIWLVLLFVADGTWRRSVAVLLFVAEVALCHHFVEIVHRTGWTGNPAGMRAMEQNRPKVMIKEAEEFLATKAATDAIDYPAGWLKDLPPINAAETSYEFYLGDCPGLGKYSASWHSWFTGLYDSEQAIDRDLWYLGGPIKDAKGRIVVKDRQ